MKCEVNDLWEYENDASASFSLISFGLIRSDFVYDSTPSTAEVFACTGGDGVHYGELGGSGGPIIMVVPMMGEEGNRIVGSDLYEFLCLGYHVGYFPLEQLVYEPTKTDWINDEDASDEAIRCFRKQFMLHPWQQIQQRLAELQERFGDMIR